MLSGGVRTEAHVVKHNVMRRYGSLVAVAAACLLGIAPAARADDGNKITSTGGGGVDTRPYVAPASAQLRDKDQIAASVLAQLKAGKGTSRSGHGGGVTPNMCPPDFPDCVQPTAVYLSAVNYKEGSGNPCTPGTTGCSSIGHKYYTCAAASTRNMTATLTGTAQSELHFENALQISKSDGLLGISHIPSVLNSEYPSYGTWKAYAPTSSSDYLSRVVTDVRSYGQSVIQNIQTSKLPYFSGVSLTHYDVVYGFDTRANTVAIAEEWDPEWTFGSLPSKYKTNPFGLHQLVASSAGYSAVHASPNMKFVI
jgi:hypothetical protein